MIPLGILGNRRGGAAAGAYELISTAYGTGSSGVITFSSVPSDYKHLQIRWTAKNSSTATGFNVTFNSDTAANYARHYLRATGSLVQSSNAADNANIAMVDVMAASTTADAFAAGVADILDYASTSKFKTLRSLHGNNSNVTNLDLFSGLWRSTSAISSITLTATSGNFTSTSRFSLYGIKG